MTTIQTNPSRLRDEVATCLTEFVTGAAIDRFARVASRHQSDIARAELGLCHWLFVVRGMMLSLSMDRYQLAGPHVLSSLAAQLRDASSPYAGSSAVWEFGEDDSQPLRILFGMMGIDADDIWELLGLGDDAYASISAYVDQLPEDDIFLSTAGIPLLEEEPRDRIRRGLAQIAVNMALHELGAAIPSLEAEYLMYRRLVRQGSPVFFKEVLIAELPFESQRAMNALIDARDRDWRWKGVETLNGLPMELEGIPTGMGVGPATREALTNAMGKFLRKMYTSLLWSGYVEWEETNER